MSTLRTMQARAGYRAGLCLARAELWAQGRKTKPGMVVSIPWYQFNLQAVKSLQIYWLVCNDPFTSPPEVAMRPRAV
jgi:hypothetical protein